MDHPARFVQVAKAPQPDTATLKKAFAARPGPASRGFTAFTELQAAGRGDLHEAVGSPTIYCDFDSICHGHEGVEGQLSPRLSRCGKRTKMPANWDVK